MPLRHLLLQQSALLLQAAPELLQAGGGPHTGAPGRQLPALQTSPLVQELPSLQGAVLG